MRVWHKSYPSGENYKESWRILLILNILMNVSEAEGIFDSPIGVCSRRVPTEILPSIMEMQRACSERGDLPGSSLRRRHPSREAVPAPNQVLFAENQVLIAKKWPFYSNVPTWFQNVLLCPFQWLIGSWGYLHYAGKAKKPAIARKSYLSNVGHRHENRRSGTVSQGLTIPANPLHRAWGAGHFLFPNSPTVAVVHRPGCGGHFPPSGCTKPRISVHRHWKTLI